MCKANKPDKSVRQVCEKTSSLSEKLMEKCLNSTITSVNAIEILRGLQSLTSEIIFVQKEHSYVSKLMKSLESRKKDLENFLSSDNYTVHWFEKYGFGLTACVPIKVTTHYYPEVDELIFCTMEAYKPGDQIFMDYGNRSNDDFFMFSGFIPQVNLNNKLTITLGKFSFLYISISSSDSLALTRKQLLQTFGLSVPLKCDLRGNIESMTEFFIFSRIFSMDKDELNKCLVNSESNRTIIKSQLSSFEFNKEISSECKALSFMINRLKLLIAAYGTLLLEDSPEWNQLTSTQQNCELLKHHEINILRSSIENIQYIMDNSYDVINNNLLAVSMNCDSGNV
ncbi:hypothetical protein Smp_148360 [Schistosoma mansoni]|uniref:hypothetical protein n=1 Tax=Schistosoma mansoni TaxID=6183 RepID=UPI00022DBF76|nr:hypothetical protein Smp_148360 [Schistosoma mansoni]|eukprot:XP_018650044.1 hypothetical protein Smp_148360 [Schistosoma mansoni]